MIFIYPALCSQNVDPRIVPAITRALEKFYLMNLCEAFSSGSLRPKSKWDRSRSVYGNVVLEATKKSQGILSEIWNMKKKLQYTISEFRRKLDNAENLYVNMTFPEHTHSSVIESKVRDINVFVNYSNQQIGQIRDQLSDLLNASTTNQNLPKLDSAVVDELKKMSEEAESMFQKFERHCDNVLKILLREASRIDSLAKSYKNKEKSVDKLDKDSFDKEKWKEDQEEKKREREKEEAEVASALKKPHAGGWKLQEYSGIGFEPTIAQVNVKIQYIGGPYDDIDNRDSKIDMNVGVKIVPYKVLSSNIINALFDDYFSFGYQQIFMRYWRKTARLAVRFVEKFIYKLSGKNVDLLSKTNPINRELLYAPEHGVDASSFKRKTNSPFYQFAAALVVLNRDEIKEIDNILTNPNQLKKLLKMGWNSICVLDDINEYVYFITTIDGGYIHQLPYAYVFSSLKMDKTYENIDDLQKQTRQFESSSGSGFSAFGSKILKENLLLASVRKYIKYEGN